MTTDLKRGRKPMPKPEVRWVHDLPNGAVALAKRRTKDFIKFYGRNIGTLSLLDLTYSSYLQGVEDTFNVMDKTKPEQPIDYAI